MQRSIADELTVFLCPCNWTGLRLGHCLALLIAWGHPSAGVLGPLRSRVESSTVGSAALGAPERAASGSRECRCASGHQIARDFFLSPPLAIARPVLLALGPVPRRPWGCPALGLPSSSPPLPLRLPTSLSGVARVGDSRPSALLHALAPCLLRL